MATILSGSEKASFITNVAQPSVRSGYNVAQWTWRRSKELREEVPSLLVDLPLVLKEITLFKNL